LLSFCRKLHSGEEVEVFREDLGSARSSSWYQMT
jgi:hypothetical protein